MKLVFTVNNYLKNKLGNNLKDEGCKIINQILLENEIIQKINLGGKLF
jgi:hypothetical protein